ncbi:MAG TPA: ABC transporter ATP-binding protein [Paraburkholderia sp.]|uniref:ABC transporter ATP-binding protein n=1 Tax=Paraburkholderia sp. TaxID=1926495 RepID=UPI002B68E3B8|nr:ABC transporter ATP-binding protein [Paraburkholderia sp.]HTR07595.1 ABC transporter ATP-binding protein [Paraburkholderia sp.]
MKDAGASTRGRAASRVRGRKAAILAGYAGRPLMLLWQYVAGHLLAHALILLAIVAAVGCALASQYALRNLVDALAGGRAHPRIVVDAFLVIVGLLMADCLLWRLGGWLSVRTFVAVTGDVRRQLFGYVAGHSPAYFSNIQPGMLASRISATANAIYTTENTVAWNALPSFLTMMGAIAILGCISLWMAMALVLVSGSMAGFLFWRASKGSVRHRQFASLAASVDGELVDVIGNMSTVKMFVGVQYESVRFASILDEEMMSRQISLRYLEKLRLLHSVVTLLLSAGLLAWVIGLWARGQATTGDVVLVSSLGFAILHGARDLAGALVDMTQHVARLADAANALLVIREMDQPAGMRALELRDANIDFENVTFAYPGRRPVLDHFSVHIDAGQHVGLVGPSGAGKSTVLALLQRFFDPPRGSGAVCISGQRLCDVNLASLHEAIGVVPQEISLFNRSLFDNLRYGRPDATQDDVLRACELANCLDVVHCLPEGLQTIVGERGSRLSGGQRQRIAIARAFLKNAPILLLDEATSALDSESEALVQVGLEALMKGRTVVAIAHRLSTLRNFDRIVVMQHGRLVDEGAPLELAGRPGIYRDVLLRSERQPDASAEMGR